MKWTATFLILAFASTGQAVPQDEYKARLAALSKSTAAKHYSVGDYLAMAQMYQWAREQYVKVIENDPDHEPARRKLGFRKNGDGNWENDPSSRQESGNRKKAEDADRVRKVYLDRLESAGRDLSRQWVDLALWCRKNSLDAESLEAFRKTLEYDPTNATARKELGYEKDAKGIWLSKAEREIRKEMKDGISKAPQGTTSNVETAVEKALGIKNQKRESGHFLMESPHLTDIQLGTVLQHAEHSYEIFHKLFGQTDLFGDQKLNYVALTDEFQHHRYVDAFFQGSPEQKALARKSTGTGGFPQAELYQGTSADVLLYDWVIHSTTETLLKFMVEGEYCWLYEGLALHFTRLMKDTASIHCVDLAGTSPKNKGKNYSDPTDWPVICRVWVRENKDPDLTAVIKCTNMAELDGAEVVKAWSIVEFLLAEHRLKFLEFLKVVKREKDDEKALKAVWGWSITDLDYRWKQYVRVTY